jgi:hypothetical protein
MRSAAELFEELNAVDESNRIEAKRASDVGKSVMETVIAFANEPGLGGGYLLLSHSLTVAKVASPQLALDIAGAESPPAPTQACNPELATLLATLQGRITEDALRQAIVRLCAWAPLTVEQLATLLGKSRDCLRNKHLIPMVSQGQLRFRYPETAKHPHQAYVTPVDAIPREPQR